MLTIAVQCIQSGGIYIFCNYKFWHILDSFNLTGQVFCAWRPQGAPLHFIRFFGLSKTCSGAPCGRQAHMPTNVFTSLIQLLFRSGVAHPASKGLAFYYLQPLLIPCSTDLPVHPPFRGHHHNPTPPPPNTPHPPYTMLVTL